MSVHSRGSGRIITHYTQHDYVMGFGLSLLDVSNLIVQVSFNQSDFLEAILVGLIWVNRRFFATKSSKDLLRILLDVLGALVNGIKLLAPLLGSQRCDWSKESCCLLRSVHWSMESCCLLRSLIRAQGLDSTSFCPHTQTLICDWSLH